MCSFLTRGVLAILELCLDRGIFMIHTLHERSILNILKIIHSIGQTSPVGTGGTQSLIQRLQTLLSLRLLLRRDCRQSIVNLFFPIRQRLRLELIKRSVMHLLLYDAVAASLRLARLQSRLIVLFRMLLHSIRHEVLHGFLLICHPFEKFVIESA